MLNARRVNIDSGKAANLSDHRTNITDSKDCVITTTCIVLMKATIDDYAGNLSFDNFNVELLMMSVVIEDASCIFRSRYDQPGQSLPELVIYSLTSGEEVDAVVHDYAADSPPSILITSLSAYTILPPWRIGVR